ncbi:hypothetical protein [Streptomyces sp. NPDC097619]|uniref:type II toxin-antitoxin system HicB family antitoxin n=1 Tax=Streptomyces sp. NPDC097619 TaxID=3157228 RepID=UPI00331D1B30
MNHNDLIRCPAYRRGRAWTVRIPEHGVYAHGRTLARARENALEALDLIGVPGDVQLVPTSAELEKLRAARVVVDEALTEAVRALALRHANMGDIAAATGTTRSNVKRILAESEQSAGEEAAGPVLQQGETREGDGESPDRAT